MLYKYWKYDALIVCKQTKWIATKLKRWNLKTQSMNYFKGELMIWWRVLDEGLIAADRSRIRRLFVDAVSYRYCQYFSLSKKKTFSVDYKIHQSHKYQFPIISWIQRLSEIWLWFAPLWFERDERTLNYDVIIETKDDQPNAFKMCFSTGVENSRMIWIYSPH